MTIDSEGLKVILRKLANWKALGPDGVHGFWYKKFTSLHAQMATQLNECLAAGEVPEWMTKGRTVLIQKDVTKGNIASNYRPITFLLLMWKILSGITTEKVCKSLEERGLLLEEKKGCRRGSRGTNDLLLMDKNFLKEVKARRKNIARGCIDYRQGF